MQRATIMHYKPRRRMRSKGGGRILAAVAVLVIAVLSGGVGPVGGDYGHKPKCVIKYDTVYVTAYHTIFKEKCHTVYKQVCNTIYVTTYVTKYEKKCIIEHVPKCTTIYDTVYKKKCGVSYDYKVRNAM